MDENPYKAPAGERVPVNALNWKRIALGIAAVCAIAAAVAFFGAITVGVNVSKQVDGERQSREGAKAREAAKRADE